MILKELNYTASQRLRKLNETLRREHGISIKLGGHSLDRLRSLRESAEANLISLRGTTKKFQLDPDYAKFLGIRDAIDIMIGEGIHKGGRAYNETQEFVRSTIQSLADEGRDLDTVRDECLARCRCLANSFDDSTYVEMIETCLSEMNGVGQEDAKPAKTEKGKKVAESAEVGDQYDWTQDAAGGIIITNTITGEDAYIQPGDDAGNFLDELADFESNSGYEEGSFDEFVTANEYDQMLSGADDQINESLQQGDRVKVKDHVKKWGGRTGIVDGTYGKELLVRLKGRTGEVSFFPDELTVIDQLTKDEAGHQGLDESLDLGEAEVVIAARAFSSAIADQIEKLGRMINEDLVAIADQLAKEMGPDASSSFTESMQTALNTQLESAHSTKTQVDDLVTQLAAGGEFSGSDAFAAEVGDDDGVGDGDLDLNLNLDDDDAEGEVDLDLDDPDAEVDMPDDSQSDLDPSELKGAPLGRAEA